MNKRKGVIFYAVLAGLILSLSGCGVKVSTKSPEHVVKSILEAYQKEDKEAVRKCFGLDPEKKSADEIETEITYRMEQFKLYQATDIEYVECKTLGEFNGYDLVYAIYELEHKKENEKKSETIQIPGLSMYFVKEKDKEFYIVPAKDITEDLSKISADEFAKFTKTEEYKTYEKSFDKFIRENPEFEKIIYEQ